MLRREPLQPLPCRGHLHNSCVRCDLKGEDLRHRAIPRGPPPEVPPRREGGLGQKQGILEMRLVQADVLEARVPGHLQPIPRRRIHGKPGEDRGIRPRPGVRPGLPRIPVRVRMSVFLHGVRLRQPGCFPQGRCRWRRPSLRGAGSTRRPPGPAPGEMTTPAEHRGHALQGGNRPPSWRSQRLPACPIEKRVAKDPWPFYSASRGWGCPPIHSTGRRCCAAGRVDRGFFLNRPRQLRQQIVDGRSDANIRFDDLRSLLRRLGFSERVRGSHHIFRMEGIAERLNLQRDGSHAKPYQVRQVRRVILRYTLEEPD